MVKQAAPLLLALGAFGAALRLARPGGGRRAAGRWLLAAAPRPGRSRWRRELMLLPAPDWMPAMMGQSNGQCVGFITLMALPLLAVDALGAPRRAPAPGRRSAGRWPGC